MSDVPPFAKERCSYDHLVNSDTKTFNKVISEYSPEEQETLKKYRRKHMKRVRSLLPLSTLLVSSYRLLYANLQKNTQKRHRSKRAQMTHLRALNVELKNESESLRQHLERLENETSAYQKKKALLEEKKGLYVAILEAHAVILAAQVDIKCNDGSCICQFNDKCNNELCVCQFDASKQC